MTGAAQWLLDGGAVANAVLAVLMVAVVGGVLWLLRTHGPADRQDNGR